MSSQQRYKVRQIFTPRGLPDPGAAVQAALACSALDQKLQPGMTVGLTVGSRGIRNIVKILRKTADYVKSLGCRPVLITAMGSHGGGRPEGQRKLLCSLGITEDHRGGLLCSTDCFVAGDLLWRCISKQFVLKCDALVVVNQVKPILISWRS